MRCSASSSRCRAPWLRRKVHTGVSVAEGHVDVLAQQRRGSIGAAVIRDELDIEVKILLQPQSRCLLAAACCKADRKLAGIRSCLFDEIAEAVEVTVVQGKHDDGVIGFDPDRDQIVIIISRIL